MASCRDSSWLDHAPVGLDVVIASPGLPHDAQTLSTRSLGGSETAALMVAGALARRGHSVTLFAHTSRPSHSDGITFQPIAAFPEYSSVVPHAVTIVSRDAGVFRMRAASPVHILWVHDLALKRSRPLLGGIAWNLDAIYVLSEFMRRQYREVHPGLPEEIFFTTRNGIDLASIDRETASIRRDRNKLVYGSRPERGLEAALAVMDQLARRGSSLRLEISGYENTPPQLAAYYQALFERARAMPNVVVRGPLKQADWHRQLASAGALIYPGVPGEFREISCIVAMEAQACGTPIVACAKGALPETCHRDAAVFLGDESTDVGTPEYAEDFAHAVEELLADEVRWQRASRAGRRRAARLDWAGVAMEWEQHWYELLLARVRDPVRVARGLRERGALDIDPAFRLERACHDTDARTR